MRRFKFVVHTAVLLLIFQMALESYNVSNPVGGASFLVNSSSASFKCDARARRMMAATTGLKEQAKHWRLMARCMVKQFELTQSHLFLHVSKSGGTSIGSCFSHNRQDRRSKITL